MSELALDEKADENKQTPQKRNWKGFLIRIIGSALVLALLYYFLPRDKLLLALETFSIEIWMAGVSCYLCLHLIGVAKWRMLINAAGGKLSFVQAIRCYYYGLFGNTFLPSVIGGDLIRAGLAFKLSQSKSAVIMGGLVDRTIDSLGLALVAGIGVLMIPMRLDENSRKIFWGFAAGLLLVAVLLMLILLFLPVKRLPYKWRRRWVKVVGSARKLAKSWKKILIALFAVTMLQTLQVVMNFWLGLLALISNANFFTWLFVWPVAKLSAMAPLTQGGIGVREAVQGTLFLPFGVSMEKAVATGLMFQAIIITGNLLGGLLAMLMGRFSSMAPKALAIEGTHSRKWITTGAFSVALLMFFVANTLMMGWGTGALSGQWLEWMNCLPGYGVDFAASVVGLLYGLLLGGILGWLVFLFVRYLSWLKC